MALKAMTKVIKAQGEALRDLENEVPTKANKHEMQSQLANKANVGDIT